MANTDTFARENNAANERGSVYTGKINPAERVPGATSRYCSLRYSFRYFFLPFGQNAKKRNLHEERTRKFKAIANNLGFRLASGIFLPSCSNTFSLDERF